MGIFSALFGKTANNQKNKPVPAKSQKKQNSTSSQGGMTWNNMLSSGIQEKSASLTVYDYDGNPLQLTEADQKNSGGEGIIYGIVGKPGFLIKIYKDDIQNKSEKIRDIRKRILDMVRMQQCSSMKFLAWPCMPVFNRQKDVIGFVMRKVEGHSFLSLRGCKSVQRFFPNWDRSDLARVALDYIKKLRELTKHNVLVNDFNPSNFLIDKKGYVSFIDCDSFQIPSSNGGVHITKTFFPSHCAPELLCNNQLMNKPRTIHQVEFGAALTVFNILMLGLHPYNYYDPHRKSACGTPDENLKQGRCPLGIGSDCRLPEGNWYNLWSYLTGTLKGGLIMTFKDGHSDPSKRISLDDLEKELEKLLYEMSRFQDRCDLNPDHPKPKLNWDPDGNPGKKNASTQPFTQKRLQRKHFW